MEARKTHHRNDSKKGSKKNGQEVKIELNRSWYLFYGRKMGMSKQEILVTPFGEMQDMMACMAIFEGRAVPKKKKKWTFDEAIKLR